MSLTRSLKALADENRMKILHMLLNSDLCVGALASQIGISKPADSQHLRIMSKEGLVRGEKRGYWTHYMVDRQSVLLIAEELKKLGETPKINNTICQRIHEMPHNNTETKEAEMCQNCCRQPDLLQGKPENFTPEQIIKCHGSTREHSCSQEDRTCKEK